MYKRYQDVLDLVQLIDTTKDADNSVILNEICEYFHQHFANPNDMYSQVGNETCKRLCADVRSLLMSTGRDRAVEFKTKLFSMPPEFAALVWPIAVMRYILRDLNITVNPRKCAGMKLFFDAYGFIILRS